MALPIPSHIHYELLLRLLERQTLPATEQDNSALREQIQQLIITLRKALAQQKQIEATCQQRGLELDYRWSLNSPMGANKAIGTEIPLSSMTPIAELAEPIALPEKPGSV
ncbi:DUF5340 domain-containing protein [Leptolyngbya sp. FACHB-261]|uniref:DUF5340 domain-containing protein n=1 Tax=Leptolyngbya sp. FACHB-261 TaxID=2692806 RepID=UPI001682A45C|nr:DUF5340 domain-containing protein [Leptolyngbya sp. FACHB-261]MBD2100905.1 DUF5340 domain-containing protein [Leptolyngbya sp. FACHB-261]